MLPTGKELVPAYRIVNDAEANALRKREYRSGWAPVV